MDRNRRLWNERHQQLIRALAYGNLSPVLPRFLDQQDLNEGAVSPDARQIVGYWSKKTVAGLLLMPPARHCLLHWNEALWIK